MTITDLRKYTERMNAKCEPTDKFRVTLNRAAMTYMMAFMSGQKRKMEQSLTDPKTTPTKRKRRENEMYMITEAMTALEKGERI